MEIKFENSEKTDQIDKAILKAQMDIGVVVKANVNPRFNSKYADINDILNIALGPLNQNGIILMQPPVGCDGKFLTVLTMLRHAESGQYYQTVCSYPMVQETPQAAGSAETYGRRYSLVGILSLSQFDDDGNAATFVSAPSDEKKSAQYGSHAKMSDKQKPLPLKRVFRSEKLGICVVDNNGNSHRIETMTEPNLKKILADETYKDAWDEAKKQIAELQKIEKAMDK